MVFVGGELIGGLDVIVELEQEEELADTLGIEAKEDINTRLKKLIGKPSPSPLPSPTTLPSPSPSSLPSSITIPIPIPNHHYDRHHHPYRHAHPRPHPLLFLVSASNKIMLFMKGSPSEPRCGFSRTIVSLLSEYNIAYGHFDILGDEEVRQALKLYSNWKTYPQLYVDNELVGGLDVVKELHADGELSDILSS